MKAYILLLNLKNNMQFGEMSLIEIRNELMDATKMTDMDVTFEMDLFKTRVSMKIAPKNQRLDLHTEHSVMMMMPAVKSMTFEEHCAKLMVRMWEKHDRNYYKCLSEIQDEYTIFKSKNDD